MDLMYRVANGVGRAAMRALAVDVGWQGAEHIERSGPALLASTHVAFVDFPFVERVAITRGRRVRFMCRHDVWHNPILARAMDAMRHIPVDRQVGAHAYLRARSLLEQGEAVCVFPEAGISHSFTVRPLMRGVASLSRETGVPIVPIAVWGPQRLSTVGDPNPPHDLTRGRRVDVVVGAPIEVAPDDDLIEVTRHLGQRLTGQLEDLQRRPAHLPRPGEYAEWYPAHLGGNAPTRAEALRLDEVPFSAVVPTWGPTPEVFERHN